MSPEILISDKCTKILNQVRSSDLNFAIQETPFSMYLTIRKSLNKNCRNHSSQVSNPHLISHCQHGRHSDKLSELCTELEYLKTENENLKVKIEDLE